MKTFRSGSALIAMAFVLLAASASSADTPDIRSLFTQNSQLPLGSGASLPMLPPQSFSENSIALQNQSGLFEAVQDSAYVLGPGDILTVGLGNHIVNFPVNPEGYLVVDNISPIYVANVPLKDAKRLIAEKMGKAYKVDRIFVTLGKAKHIMVSVTGAVQKPGVYETSATSHLTDIVYMAGGFSYNASKSILITRKDGTSFTADLGRYFISNDFTQNPYLAAGDLVRFEEVAYDKPVVQIRENDQLTTVQLRPNQTAQELISEYYCFRAPRNWDIIRVYDGQQPVKTVARKEAKDFIPQPGSTLELQAVKLTVFVSGAVARPAPYEYNANFTPLDYIASAGITQVTGRHGSVAVIGPDGETRTIDSSTGKIAPGDHIIVPQSVDSSARDYLTLLVSIASIVSSIAITVVTLQSR